MQQRAGVYVSHTETFTKLRGSCNEKKRAAQRRIRNRFELACQELAKDRDLERQSIIGFLGFSWTPKSSIFYDDKRQEIDLVTIPCCKQCGELFSFFGNKKLQCPTCLRILCQQCIREEYAIPLDPPLSGCLEVCKRCYVLILKEQSHAEFRFAIEESQRSRLILWYNTLRTLRSEIDMIMPALKGIIHPFSLLGPKEALTVMGVETLVELTEQALEKQEEVTRHLKNLDNRLKLILNMASLNPREDHIKRSLKISTAQFLERTLPEFKILISELQKFVTNPLIQNTLQVTEDKKREESRRKQQPPSLPQPPSQPPYSALIPLLPWDLRRL
eukprot:TRINITY_DN10162_c0_g1_i3.p1 TRINITY_DN10162_c0_g1~~TRINITY_DN10162_c0_g1_i3.p1  ORF type:complete len:331 (+),score=53.67 TRINITY_DN10162_c0_g1_i3:436-1428(+)